MSIFIPLLLMAIVTVSGCAHTFTAEKVGLVLVSGKTTQQEVLEAFGSPKRKLKTPGMKITTGTNVQVVHASREVWWYSPHQMKLIDAIEPEPLTIVFDENGVVVRYDYAVDDGDD